MLLTVKKIILFICFLFVFSNSIALAAKITFPCTQMSGQHYATFIIDMDKKIVFTGGKQFEFLKGSTDEIVKTASFIKKEEFTYSGMFFEFHLKDKIAFLSVKEKISKIDLLKAMKVDNSEKLFKSPDHSFTFFCGEE